MDYWNQSIELNNHGVQSLLQGQLEKAIECFREASEFNAEASYESAVDGFGVYASQWIALSDILNQIAGSDANVSCLISSPPSAIAIGHKVPGDSFVHDVERQSKFFVTRLDWIIEFNLATALQLCGVVDNNYSSDCLEESFDLYGEVAQDVLEWNNYSATIDVALFLLAIYTNQASICAQRGEHKLELLYRIRVDRIRQCYAHSIQTESQRQRIMLASSQGQCAPVA